MNYGIKGKEETVQNTIVKIGNSRASADTMKEQIQAIEIQLKEKAIWPNLVIESKPFGVDTENWRKLESIDRAAEGILTRQGNTSEVWFARIPELKLIRAHYAFKKNLCEDLCTCNNREVW